VRTLDLDLGYERRLNEILVEALDQPKEEVEAFLQNLRDEDPKLLAEVRELLQAEGHLGAFLEQPAAMLADFAEEDEEASASTVPMPDRVGPFRILESLGEGGMGRVFLAEQTEPVQRRVALKLIRTSLTGAEAAARFSAERQALARLSHPNIAQIFEAGTTDDGFPYFAMEYLPGVPVTEYCDTHRLSLDQRLNLFTAICRAVHHAHSKGIIHRDLKPSNLLVAEIDGRPVPKVIDFGIAKALDQPLTDATIQTAQRIIGTPAYMSPEALYLTDEEGDVDTRTDVYALGILLYELVAGTRPFETSGASMAQVLRKIAEEDPQRPNTRLRSLPTETQSEVAENRQIDLRSFRQRLASDLGWIVMKAIAKQRTDRYPSASELAEDVKRHLRDEPVLAGPPSLTYRIKKFVRRNRWKLAAAAMALVLSTTAIAIQVRASLRADNLARLSEQLGREVERIEWVQRVAYQLPKQNLTAEHERIRESMSRIEGRRLELGGQGSGPGGYALGRGALALQDLDSARSHLERALASGYDRPEVLLTLGLTLDGLFQRRMEAIDLVDDPREHERLRQQAEKELRDPARDLLSRSGDADTIAPELLEAHLALFDGNFDLAESKSREARTRLPWLYEAAFLEARVHRRRAGMALREKDLDAAILHALEAEDAILAGLEVGRSDPRGYFQLCSLRAMRLNLSVRYNLPNGQKARDAALAACADVRTVEPGHGGAELLEGSIWTDWADFQIWELNEDPTDSFRRAEERFEGVIESRPDNARAWRMLGRSKALEATYWNRAGKDPRPLWKEGIERLRRAVELAPNQSSPRILMSRMLGNRAAYKQYRGEDPREDLDQSAALLRSVLTLDESDERAWFYLVSSLVFRADYKFHRGIDPMEDLQEATRAAVRTRGLDPNLVPLDNNQASIEVLKAMWLNKVGQDPTEAIDRAIESARRALANQGDSAFPNFLIGHAHLERARYLWSRGEDPEEAIRASREKYSQGLSLLPRISGALVELASLELLAGRHRLAQNRSPEGSAREAEKQARKALDTDPSRDDAHRTLGLASLLRADWLRRTGQDPRPSFVSSRRHLEASLEMDPKKSETHLALARLSWDRLAWRSHTKRKQAQERFGSLSEEGASELLDRGLHHASEALRLDPAQAEALALQGALMSLTPGSMEAARALVEEALRRNRHLAHIWQPWLERQPEPVI